MDSTRVPTIYSRKVSKADDDLSFRLKRSIELVKETKMTKKKAETKERATVSRERRLALALRAVLDSIGSVKIDPETLEHNLVAEAEMGASNTLDDLGYSTLVGIPRRLKQLSEQLAKAVESGDGKQIARLGLELERAKAGKEARVVKEASNGQ